jgi:sugar phosphate isomerase/epimerase
MVNIFLSSPAFCFKGITENAEEFSRHFDNWEIISEHRNDILEHKDELKEVMGSFDMGFRVHAPFSDINTASVNRSVREFGRDRIIDNIKVCNEVGIDVITVHPGWRNPVSRFNPGMVPELNREFALRLSHAQEEYGVAVGLENMPYGTKLDCACLEDFLFVTRDTEVYLTLDIGHAFMEDALDEFFSIKDRIVNVHVHDNMGNRDEHLVLGEGECDLKDVFSKLLPIDNPFFKDSLVIESNSFPEAIKSQDYLKGLLSSLGFL